jgi:drug/metabolite transporter (DMT)-like permease
MEDVTRINVWWNLIPLFSFPLAWMFIGERIQGFQLYAFCFLLIGGIIASLHIKNYRIVFSKALLYMMLATASFAGYAVALRAVTQSVPFTVVFVWSSIIAAIIAISFLISPSFRRDFLYEWKRGDTRLFGITVGNTFFDRAGIFFNVWALSLGPAALVFSLEAFQTIFVFILAIGITIKNPSVLQEELDTRNVFLKVAALVFMLMGIALLYR